ncbi:MAG: hypothetical protein L6N95_03040 [Candidatus Methylarchaceae archaeon HK01B]|nr:hypothetical protein [Candidatus Methylarchaceae archaeon HK02M1]MCP8318787.1 hypothetical protein [Candidatus Methylarchaceae archaeon HK01B]
MSHMARTLFVVPKMYTQKQFRLIAKDLPPDFEERHAEFWSYVKERTFKLTGRINRIYFDSLTEFGEEGLKDIMSEDEDAGEIVKSLMQSGTILHSTEDKVLVGETKSWLSMMETMNDETIVDMLHKNMKERDEFVCHSIDSTLKKGEMAILFLSPERKVGLSEDIKVVRVCRFEPLDYLKSYLVQINIRSF